MFHHFNQLLLRLISLFSTEADRFEKTNVVQTISLQEMNGINFNDPSRKPFV